MDRRATLLTIMMPVLMIASFILGFFSRQVPRANGELMGKVMEVSAYVKDRYPLDVAREKLERSTIEGLLQALDPACEYYTADEWKDYKQRHMDGRFYGVGVLIEPDRDSGYLLITTPIEGTPAFAGDVQPNDLIVAVDGTDIKGMATNDIVKRIKGELGTNVRLTLFRKGRDRFDVTLTRAEIKITAVKHKMLDADVGYIRITDFTDMMPQFDKAVADLASKGMRSLIIDLRFNGGGLLHVSADLADRFIPEGSVLVHAKGRRAVDERLYPSKSGDDLPNYPLVVLVNEGTASASEVFAGAMKDLKRGVMVGSRTYGKGTVQTPIDLADGSHLKLTTSHWFTPGGTNVNKQPGVKDYGLEPDYLVEMTSAEAVEVQKQWAAEERKIKGEPPPTVKPAKDFQLDAALEIVKARLAGREPKVDRRDLSKVPPKADPQ